MIDEILPDLGAGAVAAVQGVYVRAGAPSGGLSGTCLQTCAAAGRHCQFQALPAWWRRVPNRHAVVDSKFNLGI